MKTTKGQQFEAVIIQPDGTTQKAEPKNGTDFKLEELSAIVGGHIEIVSTPDGRLIVCDEEGKLKNNPQFNRRASQIYDNPNDVIVGTVLVCNPNQIL